MTGYRVKNWGEFQHYKDRNPPWIRLHKKLLDNYDFHKLPVASRALAPMLWLLASEHKDHLSGIIEGSDDELAFRLRMTLQDFEEAIKPLILGKHIEIFTGVASKALAHCKQVAIPETETDRTETEAEATLSRIKMRAYPEEFEKLWQKWPEDRRKMKPQAYKAWCKCIKRVSPEYLLRCLALYLGTDKDAKRGYYPFPQKWLNGEVWEQYQPPAQADDKQNAAEVASLPHGKELITMFMALQKLHKTATFRSWLAPLRVKHKDSKQIILSAPTRFHSQWLETHYLTDITQAATQAWPDIETLQIQCA